MKKTKNQTNTFSGLKKGGLFLEKEKKNLILQPDSNN